MAVKRRLFAQARRAAGYTQESLAEHLGVDRTTVTRWEAGEYTPQPWLRPKIAQTLGLSLGGLSELVDGVETKGGTVEVSASLSPVEAPIVPDAVRTLANELAVMARMSGVTWEEFMRWLSRRVVLKQGLAATLVPVLGLDTVIRYPVEELSLPTGPSCLSWARPIYEAVLSPTDAARRVTPESEANAGGHLDSLVNLRRAANTIMQAELSSDYAQLVRSLPSLIGRIELANLQARDDDRLPLQRLLSDVYLITGWTLIKADSPAAAWIAAQRAIQFAEQADDMFRRAAATRCLAEVHMRAKSLHEASRTAFFAATCLDAVPAEAEAKDVILCLRGAALLSAAAASARRGDRSEAHMTLKAAAVCAAELEEERCDLGGVFGPVNLAIHRVAVATELGDASEAATYIPHVNFDRMSSRLAERRARFLIDVARTYTQLQDDAAALDALLHAETIAPYELRNHRLTHDVVRELLSRERRSSELRSLAARCGLV
jgi:DNA-binding XRE family transcriptional regulator